MCNVYENGQMLRYEKMCSNHREQFYGGHGLEGRVSGNSGHSVYKDNSGSDY